jgi:GT2 family glycosyltransferase
MNLTAVVPVWNGRDLLARLLTSLEAQTQPASELLVVDNGSTDGAPELARARGARVIPMGHNAGFAAAVNRGIRESRGEWIAVLNSDVELAPDYFAKLTSCGAPFATGKILSAAEKTRIDATFDAVCRGGVAWRVGHGRTDGPAFSATCKIFSAPWTAVLFRAEVFAQLGVLHEAFESYLEDVEFGMRCAEAGVAGLYVPDAFAWHRGSATLGRWHPETVRRMTRNHCYLVALHYPRTVLLRHAWAILLAQGLWGAMAARHGIFWPWLRGVAQGVREAPKLRRTAKLASAEIVNERLGANERAIRKIQQETGFDWFWRAYFFLTSGEAN